MSDCTFCDTGMITLTTADFWEKMCDPRFIRIDLHNGVMCGERYSVEVPPEAVDGLIEGLAIETMGMLGIKI